MRIIRPPMITKDINAQLSTQMYSRAHALHEAQSVSLTATAPAAPSLVRRLFDPMVDPATFDFWAQKLHATWSWSRTLARVVERRVEAQDAVTLVLQPNGHWAGFQPGQHLNVSAEIGGRRITRSYSLTDIPRRDGRIAITVKRVEGGRLSTQLCERTRVGDVLELGEAFGDMTLPASAQGVQGPEGRWLFLAAGSGITPLMALTRQLAAEGMPVDVSLVYWAKTRAEFCFADELRALARQHPRFQVHFVVTHEAARGTDEHEGFIDHALLTRLCDPAGTCTDSTATATATAWADRQVLACGPGGFVDAARALTAATARSFLAEGFTPTAPADLPGAGEATTVSVSLTRSGRTLSVSSGSSLLEALEAQGLNPPSGCRMGVCHTCVCQRHSGTTLDTLTGERSAEPDMAVRLCVSRACSDLSLDL